MTYAERMKITRQVRDSSGRQILLVRADGSVAYVDGPALVAHDTTLRAKHRAAVEALRKHGRHSESCNARNVMSLKSRSCNCGLDAILTPASPDPAPVGEPRP